MARSSRRSPPIKPWITKRIRARDNHTCQQCGNPGHEVDHITPRSQGGNDEETNLRTLCAKCHSAKTQQEIRDGYQRRMKRLRRPVNEYPGLKTK